jgi:hypothetical protein
VRDAIRSRAGVPSRLRCALSALSVAAGLGIAAPANAQVQIIGYLGNFDVYNRTGQAVNDFEITLLGVSRSQVVGAWNFSVWGAPTITTNGTDTFVHYAKSNPLLPDLQPGGLSHFGVHSTSLIPQSALKFTWTLDGVPVNTPPQPNLPPPPPAAAPLPIPLPVAEIQIEHAPEPAPGVPADIVIPIIRNTATVPVFVQVRTGPPASGALSLDDLLPGQRGDTLASETEVELELLEPGAILELNHRGTNANSTQSVLLDYTVFRTIDDPNAPNKFKGLAPDLANPLGTSFNAVVVGPVPEPEVWATMLVGLGLVAGAVRRRAKGARNLDMADLRGNGRTTSLR